LSIIKSESENSVPLAHSLDVEDMFQVEQDYIDAKTSNKDGSDTNRIWWSVKICVTK